MRLTRFTITAVSLLFTWWTAPSTLTPNTFAPGIATAEAAVSIAYSLEELVELSPEALVVKATEQRSEWREVASSRRIVTYTKLEIVSSVYGRPGKTLWVRTLGGAVGKIGQQVAGEARFKLGRQSLVFLARDENGTHVVSGMAQGHFPLVAPKPAALPRLRASASIGKVLRRSGPTIAVSETLVGLDRDTAVSTIRRIKRQRDALRKND